MSDKIAVDLLRLALDPSTGRVHAKRWRKRDRVDIGLRAALFCDLALAGAVTSAVGAPRTVDAGAVGHDHVLSTLAAAVARRPDVAWRRWYRNVAADRAALTRELVTIGVWTPKPGLAARFEDGAEDLDRLQSRVVAVQRFARPPGSPREAVLAYLVELCAPTAGAAHERRWTAVLAEALDEIDSEEARATVDACLRAAASVVTKQSVIGSALPRSWVRS